MGDERYVLAVVDEVERLDVVSVVQNLAAGLEGVEALEEGDDGRLAGAGRSDDGGELASLDSEVQALEDGEGSGWVAEPDVLEVDLDALLVVDLVRDDVADALLGLVVVVFVLAESQDAVGCGLCLGNVFCLLAAFTCGMWRGTYWDQS